MTRGTWSTAEVGSEVWQHHWLSCARETLLARGDAANARRCDPMRHGHSPDAHRAAVEAVGRIRWDGEDPVQGRVVREWDAYRAWVAAL